MPGKYLARGMLERPGRRFLTSWKNCWSYHDSWERNRNIFGYIHYHLKQILSGITLLKDRKDSNFLHSPGGCRHMAGQGWSYLKLDMSHSYLSLQLTWGRPGGVSPPLAGCRSDLREDWLCSFVLVSQLGAIMRGSRSKGSRWKPLCVDNLVIEYTNL